MGWRTVVIRENSKLDYKMNYLVVRKQNNTVRINLNELYMVIIESTAVSLTAVLLNELLKNKVQVIFCDDKRNPSFNLMNLYGTHDSSMKIRTQINWNIEIVETIWTKIVYEKIYQQAKFLKDLEKEESDMLFNYLDEIEYYDRTNREGHAAKVYFNSLFGKDFSRDNECFINIALNYGYSVILSAFNREVVASGYLTQLGLKHCNQYNPYNLSCDLMEPFRILVDRTVYNMEKATEFSKEHKNILIKLLNEKVIIDEKKT